MNHSNAQPLFETGIAAQPDGVLYKHFSYPGSVCLLPTGKLLAVFTGQNVHGPHEAVGAYSADGGTTWSSPVTLFGGSALSDASSDTNEGYGDPNLVIVNEKRVMVFCVSLRVTDDSLDLSRTRFWRRISDDGGSTFGSVEELPRHKKYYVGTVHPGMRLRNGTLLMGYSWDKPAEEGRPATGEGEMDCYSGALISSDEGMTWAPGGDVHVDAEKAAQHLPHATGGLDEPAIVELPDGTLFLLGRTGTDRLWQSFSHDGGLTWQAPTPSPLESHNCPAALLRLEEDGAILVVYNNHPLQRARLSARVSADGCRTWSEPKILGPIGHEETPEASYPALCQLANGTLLAVFGQIDRSAPGSSFTIRCVRFNRAYLGV
ncbi:MAG TPA: sialidase family protein [Abditibacteriaceae bacterium]|nr:sialidase family protein [Abditibacteriaceae bacterium]